MSVRPAVGQLGRISEIAQVATKHGFGYLFETRGGLRYRRESDLEAMGEGSARGRRLREMLDELGPTFVKFGQLLSTRPDLVPPDIVFELKALQDQVRPVPFEAVERVVRGDLELSIEQLFVSFEEVPVAAASIGQVHRAVLPNGQPVAVKVQRPNAPRQIDADLDLLYQVARLLHDRVRAFHHIDPVKVVDEFARTIRRELDYRLEGRAAEQFGRQFAGDRDVRIPRVYWSYSGDRVLTLELVEGVQLGDLDLAGYALDERRRLAYAIAEAWMAMIFRHGFFHADPHPANILVLPGGEIALVDFGMTGRLARQDTTNLTKLFIDAANENVDALPRRLADLGVRYPRELEQEFIAELRDVFARYYGTSIAEVDPLQVIREAFGLIYRMRLQLPPRFVMLDRAIATLGSVGVELYPDFNVFEVARPYARELMLERFTPRRVADRTRQEARSYAHIAHDLPYQLHDILQELRDGEIAIRFRHENLDPILHRMDVVANRALVGLVAMGGVVGSSLLGLFADGGPRLLGLHVISIVGYALSAVLGVWLVWAIIRSGRI